LGAGSVALADCDTWMILIAVFVLNSLNNNLACSRKLIKWCHVMIEFYKVGVECYPKTEAIKIKKIYF
jgi:hypothetical protein